jgi:hypothetical protein
MTANDDLDQQLNSFLRDGPDELPYQSFDAVRDRTEQTRQRVLIGPWRTPTMNKFATITLGAAAVVLALVVGSQLLRSPNNGTNVGGDPTATPQPTALPTPSPTDWSGLPAGAYLITGEDGPIDNGPVQTTVDIASPGWTSFAEADGMSKNEDGLDPPESAGAMLLAWAWPADTGFNVYGDPCHWTTTIPNEPATTPDEIAADLAAQASRDATAPVDVTVGGYAGKAVTLHVPLSYDLPNAPREEEFADCDNSIFATYGLDSDESVDTRNAQGPGQIDELWILDVNGSIVILDGAYSPATPADVVEELRALAESATFEMR